MVNIPHLIEENLKPQSLQKGTNAFHSLIQEEYFTQQRP